MIIKFVYPTVDSEDCETETVEMMDNVEHFAAFPPGHPWPSGMRYRSIGPGDMHSELDEMQFNMSVGIKGDDTPTWVHSTMKQHVAIYVMSDSGDTIQHGLT